MGPNRKRISVLLVAMATAVICQRAAGATFAVEDHPQLATKIIRMQGEIAKGDDERFQNAVATLKGTSLSDVFVTLESPGGKRKEAIAIARHVRRVGMGTLVLPGAKCASACMLVFFGGYDTKSKKPRRVAFQGARLGVHRPFIDLSPEETKVRFKGDIARLYAALETNIANLFLELNELDVSLEVQRRVFTTDSASMHYLTDAEKNGTQITLVSGLPGQWKIDRTDLPITAMPPGLWSMITTQREGESRSDVPDAKPTVSIRRFAGDTREVEVTWSRSFKCAFTTARDLNMRIEICPAEEGLAIDIGFRDGTFASFADWVPEFTGSSALELQDTMGRRSALKLRVRAANTSRVLVVTDRWQDAVSSLGPPRKIVLDLHAVGITLSLSRDLAEALWAGVLEHKPARLL
jgi:hypothetical protein